MLVNYMILHMKSLYSTAFGMMSSTSTNRCFFGRRVGCSRAEHIFGARCSNEAYLFFSGECSWLRVCACILNTRFMEGYGIMDILQQNPDAVQIKKMTGDLW